VSEDDKPKRLEDMLWERREQQRAQQAAQQQRRETPTNVTPLDDERRSRYAARALQRELDELLSASEGTRNDQLNRAAFNLGQLVGAHALDESLVRDNLEAAALRIGLTSSETLKTINSGLSKGVLQPRELPNAGKVSPREIPSQLSSSDDAPFGIVENSSDEPPIEPPSSSELDDFWSARPLLAHVLAYSRARRAAPWAVLGCVLARVVAATPPTVVLPPIVGGQASLNLFVGLVGRSGAGKGAAERVAAEAVRLGQTLTTATVGSGEAIAHGFVKRLRDGTIEQHTTSVLFTVPEIDTLSALSARQGATLMPELRRAWSGEQLGFQYVDPTKRLLVEAHKYRLCLVAGIQPARAKTLLDDADGGTPQRFIWCAATDPNAPDVAPEQPDPITWQPPSWNVDALRDRFSGRFVMNVCDIARKTIDDAALARSRGEVDALDGHLLLCQLKTAAALAIADRRLFVDDHDWQLAELIIRQSTSTRAGIARALAASWRERNTQRAESEAERTIIVEERQIEAAQQRASRAILRALRRDGSMTKSALRKFVSHRDRGSFDVAIELLKTTGLIKPVEAEKGERYELV
jgi:hypothetical protein